MTSMHPTDFAASHLLKEASLPSYQGSPYLTQRWPVTDAISIHCVVPGHTQQCLVQILSRCAQQLFI